MRVLFWSELFWPYIGGAQLSATRLLLGLRARGHEFIVVTRQDHLDLPKEAYFKGIPVYRFPFYQALASGNIDQLMEIRQQVVKLKRLFAPDLVHINCFGVSVLFYLYTTKARPAPLLVTLRGETRGPIQKQDALLKQTLRAADWVTAPSARTVEYARRLVPRCISHSSVIYNGLEVPSLPPEPLPFDLLRLLCLGRLAPEKGFDLALTAFAIIADHFPQMRLIIAGDGPERPVLQQQAADLVITDVVEFTGWIAPDAVPALMNTATVVVMPSRQEAFGLVALQAALMARPVVATRVGGLPEVVVHQETGLLVKKEDSVGLAQAISFLLEHPETAAQMGQAARRRAQEVFSLERYVNAYDALYQTLIEGTLSQE
jgi:glycogen(starch) synthase